MNRWKRRATQQGDAYRAQAQSIRATAEAERALLAFRDTQRRAALNTKVVRAALDDERLVAQVKHLREARERNHFTERMRSIIHGGITG